jgi:hypothetical protein
MLIRGGICVERNLEYRGMKGVEPCQAPHHLGAKDVAFGKCMEPKRVHTCFRDWLVSITIHATFKLIDYLIIEKYN